MIKHSKKDFSSGMLGLGYMSLGGVFAIIIGSVKGYGWTALVCGILATIAFLWFIVFEKFWKDNIRLKKELEDVN